MAVEPTRVNMEGAVMEVPQGLPNPTNLIKVPLKLISFSAVKPDFNIYKGCEWDTDVNSKIICEHNAKHAANEGEKMVKMEVCMCLEGCSVPPGCCEAGPVKGELQTKVFCSSGANGDKWVP